MAGLFRPDATCNYSPKELREYLFHFALQVLVNSHKAQTARFWACRHHMLLEIQMYELGFFAKSIIRKPT